MARLGLREVIIFSYLIIHTCTSFAWAPSSIPLHASTKRIDFFGTPLCPRHSVSKSYRRSNLEKSHLQKNRFRMFFGPAESFFGIGGPEAAVIFAVGYFILGPKDLYKLSKSLGLLFGQFRDYGLSAVTNLQDTMEKEIRNAENAMTSTGSNLDRLWGNDKGKGDDDEDEYEDLYEDENGEIIEGPSSESSSSRLNSISTDQEEYEDLDDDEYLSKNNFNNSPFSFRGNASGSYDDQISLKQQRKKSSVGAPSASKFQDQMSGQWNKQVLDQQVLSAVPLDDDLKLFQNFEAGTIVNDIPDKLEIEENAQNLSVDEQFERLEKLAALEEERAATMQRLDEIFEQKMRAMRGELLEIIDDDFQARRKEISKRNKQ